VAGAVNAAAIEALDLRVTVPGRTLVG